MPLGEPTRRRCRTKTPPRTRAASPRGIVGKKARLSRLWSTRTFTRTRRAFTPVIGRPIACRCGAISVAGPLQGWMRFISLRVIDHSLVVRRHRLRTCATSQCLSAELPPLGELLEIRRCHRTIRYRGPPTPA